MIIGSGKVCKKENKKKKKKHLNRIENREVSSHELRAVETWDASYQFLNAKQMTWLWGENWCPADSKQEEAKEREARHSGFPLKSTNAELWICPVTKCAQDSPEVFNSQVARCNEVHLSSQLLEGRGKQISGSLRLAWAT